MNKSSLKFDLIFIPRTDILIYFFPNYFFFNAAFLMQSIPPHLLHCVL